MHFIESTFNDFEPFKQAVRLWNLDFRLLSKNDFNAYLSLYTNEKFQIGRTKLNGKIQQFGLCPVGFRSITIPVNYTNDFFWLNKRIDKSQLLIFPQNACLDGVSFDMFDVYVVSIEESFLFETIEFLGYKNALNYFDGSEKQIHLNESFVREFHQKANDFLNISKSDMEKSAKPNTEAHTFHFDDIVLYILSFLENQKQWFNIIPERRRDDAVKKAADLINNDSGIMPKLSQLCNYSGVSERTLEYAFLEKYRVTPKDYIKATNLNKIRAELLLDKNRDCKVSTIALSHGFWHMGQFSADYKKWFGELPSETLKR